VVTEKVADDREEDPDPHHEQEHLEDEKQEIAESDIRERQHSVAFLIG
jgi:hypothetical protein